MEHDVCAISVFEMFCLRIPEGGVTTRDSRLVFRQYYTGIKFVQNVFDGVTHNHLFFALNPW